MGCCALEQRFVEAPSIVLASGSLNDKKFPIYGKIKLMFQTTNQKMDDELWVPRDDETESSILIHRKVITPSGQFHKPIS